MRQLDISNVNDGELTIPPEICQIGPIPFRLYFQHEERRREDEADPANDWWSDLFSRTNSDVERTYPVVSRRIHR